MTALRSTPRNRLMARLHAMKREMGLDEDTYRDRLQLISGSRSASALPDEDLAAAVARFRSGATVPRAARLPDTAQARMLQALWISLYNLGAVEAREDTALMAWITRQTHLEAARWLRSHADYVKVIEPLKEWLAREGVDWSNGRHDPAHMKLPTFKVAAAQWAKLERMGAVTRGQTWTGREQGPLERMYLYAKAVVPGEGEPTAWGNTQWAKVSKALGKKLRAELAKKEKAA